MDVTAWLGDLPRLLLMGVVLVVPGAIGVRLFGVRGILGWALGPVVAASVAGVGAVVCAATGVVWGAPTLAAGFGVFVVLCAVAGRRHSARAGEHTAGAGAGAPSRRALALVLPVSWLAVIAPVMARSTPASPIQQYDPVFHMNALWLILRDGNASSFGGLTRMFGMDTTSATVPTGWHALVAPFASATTIVETVNTFSLLVPLVWLIGMAALTGQLLPGRREAPVLVVALAPVVVEYPTYMLTKYPAWPNALAMALLPALIALGVAVATSWRGRGGRDGVGALVAHMVLWVFLLLGACLVHPLAGLSLLVLGLPAAVVALVRRWARLAGRGRGRRAGAEVLVALLTVVGTPVIVMSVPTLSEKLAGMTDAYQTVPNVDWYNPLKALVLWPIVDPQASGALVETQLALAVVVGLLTLVGLAHGLRSRAGQFLFASWVGAYMLTLTTLMRSGPLLPLAGLWYMSSHRAMAVQAVVQLPIMAQGLRALWALLRDAEQRPPREHARHRRTRDLLLPTALVLVLVGGAATAPSRADLTWRVYSRESPFVSVMLTDATEDLASRADELLPEDALVLGDPFNGSAYVQVLGDRAVVFPQLYFRDSNADEEYLRLHFSELTSDPQVCTILRARDIGYAWIDTNSWHAGEDQALLSPGLYGIDLRHGFEVLATADTVSLVRITACG
ncbi:MAG: DUF6541 family protein [Pauljensenia sp.]